MPDQPQSSNPPPIQPKVNRDWNRLRNRATTVGSIAGLFLFLIAGGIVFGYYYSQAKKPAPVAKTPNVQTLSQQDIDKLNEIGANLGTANQTLNIGANTLFRGKADVTGDLTIGGTLNANGPVTLSQLNITGGTDGTTGLNVGSNLNVTGATTLQKSLTVNGPTTINSNLTVTGSASVAALNASSIAVRSLTISGPLAIAHIITQGTAPTIVAGSVGSGGTVSISGNDTAGTINLNTGTGPGSALATVTFRAAYTGTVHVQLTALTGAAATAGAFVTRTATGFQIHAVNPPAGSVLSYDFLVTQ